MPMCVPPEKRLLLVITNLLPETPWACLYHFLNGNAFLRTTDIEIIRQPYSFVQQVK